MRPLIVLLLVLLAAGALLFALDVFPTATQTPEAGPSAVAAPTGGGGEDEPMMAPVGAAQGTRDRAQPVAPAPLQGDPQMQAPGLGNRLVGSVRDETDQPVSGALVKLTRDAQMGDALALQFLVNQPRTGQSISVESDAGGRYVFEDVAPAGDYYLVVSHPEFSPVQESMVAVGESGEFRGPDVVLRPGSKLVGTVRDIGGNPVPDATLALESAYSMSWDQPNPDRIETTSDVFGQYEFGNVPAGPRNLMVEADGYGMQVVQGQLNFTGEPGEELSWDFTLEPGLPIVGQVVGPEGRGVPGAHVIAIMFQNQTTSRGEADSDADGRFQIDGLREGSYILMATAEGYSQARMNRIQAGKVDVVVELKRQACVSGRVIAAGSALSDFEVHLRRTTPNPTPGAALIYENTEIRAQVRGGDGSFEVCGVPNGHYSALVTAAGFAPTSSSVFQVVDDQPPPPVTVTLSAGGRIRGRVLGPDGAPVSGAKVRCADNVMSGPEDDVFFANLFSGAATERKGSTNAEGYFELGALAPASYVVHIDHPRYAGQSVRDLAVSEGQATNLGDVPLLQGGSVRGVVLDQLGQPLARAYVQLIGTDASNTMYKARTDAEGAYVFEHVRPGSYKLSATRQPPGSSNDPFAAILEQQASEVSISVSDQATFSQNLSLGG